VGISVTNYESSAAFAGDYHGELAAQQQRLARLQLAQIVHGRRSIILFEGWEGAGKKAALKRLAASWDPCYVATHRSPPTAHDDRERHWLARYWSALPRAGETALFFRSWYRLVIDRRAFGELPDKDWMRALDAINEFEGQQADQGCLLIKLFFHVSAEVQQQRLHERGEHPWRKWTLKPEDLRSHQAREAYLQAWQEMFDSSDTRWAPWTIIDGGDKRASRIAALTAVADALERALPGAPPEPDAKVVLLAHEKYA
jgi:polyphosphate kinase 2 (PPK2 family)